MPHYDVLVQAVCLVPHAARTVPYQVQAPDGPTALARTRALFERAYPRWTIITVDLVVAPPLNTGPLTDTDPSADALPEGTLTEALAAYNRALAAYNEAKIQTFAAQGRCRDAKRALLWAFQDVQRASGRAGAVMVPR